MTVEITERWRLAAAQGGARPITNVTVTVPGGTPVGLTVDGCSVTKSLDSGARYQASVAVVRQPGQDTWGLVTTPGAIFAVDHGWHYGGTSQEIIPFGRYELSAQPKTSRSQTVSLSLMDQWKRLEECRLLSPVTAGLGLDRVSVVSAQVAAAIPGGEIRVNTTGGTVGTATTWDRELTGLVNDLSRDGSLAAHFAADGAFEINPLPQVDAAVDADAMFTDGAEATILDLSSETVYTRLYNAVRVVPTDNQAWSAVTVQITDATHPRHPDKIGLRPYFMSSPTLGSSVQALEVGRAMLRRIVSTLQRVEVDTWARGDLEPGQSFTTTQGKSWTDPTLSGTWLIETVQHNCLTLETKITGRSAADVPTEEEG